MDKLIDKVLFTAGPVERNRSIRTAEGSPSIYMRTDDFREFTKELSIKIRRIFNLVGLNYKVLYVASSGTGVMDMTVNSMRPKRALVIGKGGFSERWSNILKSYNLDYDRLDLKNYSPEQVYSILDSARTTGNPYDFIFFTLFETSSCYLDPHVSDELFIKKLHEEYDCLTAVDAISGAVVNNAKYHLHDIIVTCSQKGFGVSPGLSMMILNDQAIARYYSYSIDLEQGFYFKLNEYIKNESRGSTPWTPPTSLMYALDKSCDLILSYEDYPDTCKKYTKYLVDRLYEKGLKLSPEFSGNCVVKVDSLSGVHSDDIVNYLRDNYKIEVAPSSESNFFRVGIYNMFDEYMIDMLVNSIYESIKEIKAYTEDINNIFD